jgi:hypothetical protein
VPTPAFDYTAWLQSFVHDRGGIAGTVHLRDGGELALAASLRIPPPVLAIVQRVPYGKGMAGLAFERNQPVSTCNLQTDRTGDVRPGARAVDAQAAVALPVRDARGEVRAVVGIAFAGERTLTEDQLAAWCVDAQALPE